MYISDSRTRKLVAEFSGKLINVTKQTKTCTVDLNLAINSDEKFRNSSIIHEWNLFDIHYSNSHEIDPQTNILECLRDIAVATCRTQFRQSVAIDSLLKALGVSVEYTMESDKPSKWKVNVTKFGYEHDRVTTGSNDNNTNASLNKQWKIAVNAQINSFPHYDNVLVHDIMFQKLPFFALLTPYVAMEIRHREAFGHPASKIEFGGDFVTMVVSKYECDEHERLYWDKNPQNRYKLPYDITTWSIDETWIEWNDLDMALFDYCDVYMTMFDENIFWTMIWTTTPVLVHSFRTLAPRIGTRSIMVLDDYVKMNVQKLLEHMHWFATMGNVNQSGSSGVMYTRKMAIDGISRWKKMYHLSHEMRRTRYWYDQLKMGTHGPENPTFDCITGALDRIICQYLKIVHLLFDIPVNVIVGSKFGSVTDILHTVLPLMFIIVSFSDISLNSIKRLQFILTKIIRPDYVKQCEPQFKYDHDDWNNTNCNFCKRTHTKQNENINNKIVSDNCNGTSDTPRCYPPNAGIELSNIHADDILHYEYIDMYHTILIKLAFKQLVLTPLNQINYDFIQSLLDQVSPSYNHFIQERDDNRPFIQCKHWHYFVNEICWIEFLSGRISKLCKYGTFVHARADDVTSVVVVDNKIKQSLLKLRHAQEYCQLSSIIKFKNLGLIVKPRYLNQRINIIKKRYTKYDSYLQFLCKYSNASARLVCNEIGLRALCYTTGFSSEAPSCQDYEYIQEYYKWRTFDINQFWTTHNITSQTEWYYGLKNIFYEQEKIRCCEVCREDRKKLRLCRNCRSVRYCSRVCQKKHWKIHKQSCVM